MGNFAASKVGETLWGGDTGAVAWCLWEAWGWGETAGAAVIEDGVAADDGAAWVWLEQLFSAGENLEQLLGGGEEKLEEALEQLGVEVGLEKHHTTPHRTDYILSHLQGQPEEILKTTSIFSQMEDDIQFFSNGILPQVETT